MADDRILRMLRMMEGLRGDAYVDASGHSIGYGHFIKEGEEHLMGARLTKEQSENLLLKDVDAHSSAGMKGLKAKITQNQKTALELLAYNAGPGAAQSVVRLLNQGKPQEAADKFSEYIKSRKTEKGPKLVNPELVKRRAYERRLFLTKDDDQFDEDYDHRSTRSVATSKSTTRVAAGTSLSASVSADYRGNENARVLAEIRMLNQELANGTLDNEALNRIRIEGGGRAS